ncbi:toxic anion resistance protein [Dubosiella muris]|uniref:Toxic anion resistance protein n=1 Tax=Dubosiella muris TaxID=3038133 RepID=A0AC61R707_9FIRM|nr:toxic anion resistance protein [Dubosiella muris]TGY65886.1 toxic anion resistance protein [Dubosiella muris]
MTEENKETISLTLEPEQEPVSRTLTEPALATPKQEVAEPLADVHIDTTQFSEQEMKMIEDFASKINIKDTNQIIQYGSAPQKKLADFSEKTLESVKTKDLGDVGDMLANVVIELKETDPKAEEKKGIFGFFNKGKNQLEAMKARYAKAETNVTKVAENLENQQIVLIKDNAMLDQMYQLNAQYFKELSMYILAGKKKLKETEQTDLPQAKQKAERSQLPEDAQAYQDLISFVDRFEKKLYDLELSRMISIQTAPQLRMLQSSNSVMIDKIQTTLVNTIPLWKNQLVLAFGLNHAKQAAKAQREVTDMTNELLKKNAESLHMASVETARETNRGIVDIETLQQTNEKLIQTFDEVMQIQKEGRQKRLQAESTMLDMENQLKKKMLEIRR